MAKIRWNKIALDDLDKIAEYIAKDSGNMLPLPFRKFSTALIF